MYGLKHKSLVQNNQGTLFQSIPLDNHKEKY